MTDQTPLGAYSTSAQDAVECGVLLRRARENAGLGLSEASSQLKMQIRVLQALEDGRWEVLGAPVFVRGQLRSYAKLLKVDITPYLQQAQFQAVRPAELISHSHTPHYQRVLENIARRAVYLVITAAIAVPVWLATQPHLSEGSSQTTASLDVVPDNSAQADQAVRSGATQSTAPAQAPYVASLTPPLPRGNGNALTLRMVGDSWVQINAPDGRSVEQGLLKTGEQRTFQTGEVGRVVLGNAAAVEVQQAGSTVDLTPYKRANVARFTVSSDGSLALVAD